MTSHGCWCQAGCFEYFRNHRSTEVSKSPPSLRVYRKWSQKGEVSSEQQMCGPKRLVDVSGQRKMVVTRGTSKKMGCSSRRAHQVLSAENRKMRLQFTQTQENWTIEDWENVAGLTSLDFHCDAPYKW